MSKRIVAYKDFSGGLSEASNDNMQDNQLSVAQNVVPGDGYGIAKTNGCNMAFPRIETDKPIIEIVDLAPATGSIQTLAFTADCLYKATAAGWVSLLEGTTGITLAAIKDYFIKANKLYWLDGVKMWVYDGTSIAEAELVPEAPSSPTPAETEIWDRVKTSVCVEQRGNRWFYSRAGNNEVIFSKIGEPCGFDVTNIINVNSKDADSITALCSFADYLLIFKNKSVWYLSGWDFAGGTDIELRQLSVTSGTAFPKTVQIVENAVLYLGYNGIYRLRLMSLSTVIASENISEGILTDTIRKFGIVEAWSVVWNNVYYITFKNGTGGLAEYRYYLKLKAFYGAYTMPVHCYSISLNTQGLYAGCANGVIVRFDKDVYHYIATEADVANGIAIGDTIPIPMVAKTKWFDTVGAMVVDAKIKRIFISAKQYVAESSMPTIEVRADYKAIGFSIGINADESLVYGEGVFGDTLYGYIPTITKEVSANFKAKKIQFTIAGANLDYPVLIYGFALLFKRKRAKGNKEGITDKEVLE